MTQTIKIRNEPAQHIGVANSAPCPEMNIVAKEITENGRYEARTEGVTGFDPVIVNVPSREEIGYENGYAAGYGKGSTDGYADALAKRTELEVTANGEYIPEGESTGFSKVSVNLPSDTAVIDGLIDGTLSGAYRNDRVTSIRASAFGFIKSPFSVDFPNVTNIGDSAFSNCLKLSTANFPKVTTIGSSTFAGCLALTGADFPSLTSTGTYAFNNCPSATVANFPKLTTLNEATFMNWNALPSIDLPSVTNISTNAFYNCYVLVSVVLRAETICTLSNTSAFKNCYHILGTVNAKYNPEGLKDGFIYVWDNLVEAHRNATNWATLASQIMPLVETVDDLSGIDTTLADHACVSPEYGTYTEYYFNGTEWEVFVR